MSALPSVSIVVPAYNAVRYIGEAVTSLLMQDHPDFEIIVVDDGSMDGTADIAGAFGDRVILHRQVNAGQSAALRVGWSMARGELIGYLSADDRLRPEATRRCAEVLAARPECVLVYPDFDLIDESSHRTGTVRAPEFSRWALYANLHCMPGPGSLFRRSAYEAAGPWNPQFRQIPDLDFFLRMALHGDFIRLPEVLADFRRHDKSTTYRYAPFDRGEEPLRMVSVFLGRQDLSEDILRWESAMRSNAHLLSAAIHGQSGRTALALKRILKAAMLSPSSMVSKKTLSYLKTITKAARTTSVP